MVKITMNKMTIYEYERNAILQSEFYWNGALVSN